MTFPLHSSRIEAVAFYHRQIAESHAALAAEDKRRELPKSASLETRLSLRHMQYAADLEQLATWAKEQEETARARATHAG
jgi:hypothetical protein